MVKYKVVKTKLAILKIKGYLVMIVYTEPINSRLTIAANVLNRDKLRGDAQSV